jgi:poly(A) polymerase/tRNA nucleotidyltransferase (CCA-adding enzyme)
VTFSNKLEDDVKRRDFTVNAIALAITPIKDSAAKEGSTEAIYKGQTIDLHKGHIDLSHKILRTVGDAHERFAEDALRIIRAIRLSAELGFTIEQKTLEALHTHKGLLKNIAIERIRDEFNKIVASPEPMKGLQLAHDTGVLHLIMPELEEGIKTEQNQAHAYDVWEHLLRTCQHAADKNYPFHVKLAALLHDIGKPRSRRWSDESKQWTFYGHEVIGAKMTQKILERMKYPKKLSEQVVKLVRWHMFFSDTEQITLSAVRRMIANVGEEMVWDLMNIRICDRIGTGRPKENPYRLRKYKAMVEMVLRDPVSVGMLKIDGKRLMEVAKMPAGPKIGYILHALLEDVLEDPKLNTAEYLEGKAIQLAELTEAELKNKGEQAKAKKELEEERQLKEITDKYKVD